MIKLKDLIYEGIGESYLDSLRNEIKELNAEADQRYRKIAGGGTEHNHLSNPFEPFITTPHSTQEGHILALQDGRYKLLKKRARDMESKLRTIEKHIKK
jgi:muramidase (phage lysozyme)